MDPVQETIKTFEKYADEYQQKYMSYVPYIDTYKPLSHLLGTDAVILDAACGPGNIAKYLLDEAPDRKIHGIDLSEKMVALARLTNPDATFEVKDCREISSLAGRYDGVVAGFCFPYLSREEVKKFIGDAREKLRTNGILYVSFMEGDYAASGLQTRNGIDWVCTYYHSAQSLIDTLEAAGFEVLEAVRKAFEREGEPAAVDVFIYARGR